MKSNKLRLVAFLLSFFFGGIGVHRFYVGKTGSGITMLFCTLSIILIPISAIWGFIDMVMILCGVFED